MDWWEKASPSRLWTCASVWCTRDKFQGCNDLHPWPIKGHTFLLKVPTGVSRVTSLQCHRLYPAKNPRMNTTNKQLPSRHQVLQEKDSHKSKRLCSRFINEFRKICWKHSQNTWKSHSKHSRVVEIHQTLAYK